MLSIVIAICHNRPKCEKSILSKLQTLHEAARLEIHTQNQKLIFHMRLLCNFTFSIGLDDYTVIV
jgi:hypothetical protein